MGTYNREAYEKTRNKLTLSDIGEDNIVIVDAHYQTNKHGIIPPGSLKVVTKDGTVYISQYDFRHNFDADRKIPLDTTFSVYGIVKTREIPTVDIKVTEVVQLTKYEDEKGRTDGFYLRRNNEYIPIMRWIDSTEEQTNYHEIAKHFLYEISDITEENISNITAELSDYSINKLNKYTEEKKE